MRTILSTILLTITTLCAIAQDITLKGSLADSSGKPIAFASVMVQNTSIGTESMTDGQFNLTTTYHRNMVLEISKIGYQTLTVPIPPKGKNPIDLGTLLLAAKTEQLEGVTIAANQFKTLDKRIPSPSLRLKTEIAKLPQNIQVVGGDLLQDQQVTNIMDGLIRNVSGVSMLEHWGHFARVNMRGFRLPAFRNGVNVQDSWGPLSEDMNTVERIEFVKGPAGFMLSAGEPGGFYNVVTKKPTENLIANASFSAGSYDFYRGTFDIGGKLTENGKLLGRFNAMYQTTDTHRGGEDVQRYGIAPALTYKFSDKTSVTAEMNLQQAEAYIGSAYVFAPSNAGFGSLDRNFRPTDTNYPVTDIQEVTFFLNAKHEFSEHFSVEGQLAYLRYEQKGNSTWVFDPDGPGPLSAVNDNGDIFRYANIWDALSRGKYGQIYLYGDFNTGHVSHNVMGGFDFSEKVYWPDFSSGFFPIDTTKPFNIYNPTYGDRPTPSFIRTTPVQYRNGGTPYSASTVRAYYVQDEIGFLENKIRLTLAGRYTNLYTQGKNETDNVITPRIGLSADITPFLTVYGLFDESFLPQSGMSATGELLNDPINGKDIEGGLKATILEGRLKASLGVYKINKDKILAPDPDNPGMNFSVYSGEIESKGIEFDLQGQITPELDIVFNYANTNVEDKSGSLQAGFVKHLTNGWLNYNFNPKSGLKGFAAALGYQYQVDRSTWTWDAEGDSQLPNYFRLDGALSWKNEKLRVQVNINNILDEYLYSGADYGSYLYWQSEPGINGRITLTYNFL